MMTSARLAMPWIEPGQAQKETTHNEALAILDMTVQPCVVSVGSDTPPPAPAVGACWVVGATPGGDWSGQAHAIAGWTESGWRFVVPAEGWSVWSQADGQVARFGGGAWTVGTLSARQLVIDGQAVVGARRGAIDDVAGGATIDTQSRLAIGAILATLRGHGLIGS